MRLIRLAEDSYVSAIAKVEAIEEALAATPLENKTAIDAQLADEPLMK